LTYYSRECTINEQVYYGRNSCESSTGVDRTSHTPAGQSEARAVPAAGRRQSGEYDITLDELLAGETSPRRNREREQAKQFLAELLANGPVESETVYALAAELNIAPRTLERAKVDIGAKSHKPNGVWIWSMD